MPWIHCSVMAEGPSSIDGAQPQRLLLPFTFKSDKVEAYHVNSPEGEYCSVVLSCGRTIHTNLKKEFLDHVFTLRNGNSNKEPDYENGEVVGCSNPAIQPK